MLSPTKRDATTERGEAIDLPTVIAIAAVVYLASNVAHEVLGHGGVCLLVGGKAKAFSTAWFDGDTTGLPRWSARATSAGGTIVDLLIGGVGFAWLSLRPPRNGSHRYALWLTGAVNSFMGSGYLMTSPLFGWGDWGNFVEGLSASFVVKVGLTALGLALGAAQFKVALSMLRPIVGEASDRKSRARRLTVAAYLTGCILTTLSALGSILGPFFAITAAAATFGGTAFLPWLAAWIKPTSGSGTAGLDLPRSKGWLIAGAVSLVLYAVLGRGIVL